jgi:hypothetical protein
MTVFKGSRYEGVKFTGILGKDGKVRKYLHPRVPLTLADMKQPVIIHQFQQGEVIDELAARAAGKPRLWWLIADVSDVLFPLEIEPGTDIVVPKQDLLERSEIG